MYIPEYYIIRQDQFKIVNLMQRKNRELLSREKRYCTECSDKQIGDEFHVLLKFQNQDTVRSRNMCISEYYRIRRYEFKIFNLIP